ncbi:MAG TPA: hypothetical protein VKU41_17415, partial [Polyangiaceae bacterium]|nr:hypothetical protein [Polyangiaceae bacterium]
MSKSSSSRWLAIGVWLLLFVVNPGRNETVDVEIRRIVARQLWTTGGVAVASQIDGYTAWVKAGPDRWVAPYGIGQSLLLVPFDMMGAAVERFAPVPTVRQATQTPGASHLEPDAERRLVGWLPIGLGMLPLLGLAYWFALRALLEEWGFARPWPTLGALALFGGTIAFHYAGQAQEETLIATCLTLATLFALRLRRRPTWSDAVLTGLFAGCCILTRPVSVFG